MINHTAVAEWIGLPETTEKENELLCFSFLRTNFLYLLSKLCIKNLNLDHHIQIQFMLFFAAARKDTNIVKLSTTALNLSCLLKLV